MTDPDWLARWHEAEDPFHAFEIWHDAHFVGGLPDLNELSERVEQYSKDKTMELGNPA